ncbi:MAG: DUF5691 domain-containing protein [Nevskia sp.]|jgi:hypothetical protein|nr:DUF5691 domain-containing protein [Nevskia sp.]
MSALRQTLQIALAGVQGPLPQGIAALASEWGETETPVQALYQAATFLTQAERCARPLPQYTGPMPDPAAAETLKTPPDALTHLLLRHLDTPNSFIEHDKAACLRARGEHLPFLLLPGWFEHALTRSANEQTALLTNIGARGAWLLPQNPKWQPLLGQPPVDALWETGSLAERYEWLLALRYRDAAAGRTALQTVWVSEPPEVREKLIGAITVGISMADETLLEAARVDKRKGVREQARALLAQLPHGAFAQRLRTYARDWIVHIPGGLLRAAKLNLRLPAAYERAWALDGLPEKTTRQHEGIGDKANWLVEVMSHLPLEALLAELMLTPAAWIKLIADHEYAAALWAGSIESFERWPTPQLLEALCTASSPIHKARVQRIGLVAAATAAQVDPWLNPIIDTAFDLRLWLNALPRLDARWSRTLLKRLSALIDSHRGQPGHWADLLPRFAERADASVLADTLALLDPLGNEGAASRSVMAAMEIADLRFKLHQFHPPATA